MESLSRNEIKFTQLIEDHKRLINQICYFYSSEKIPFEDLRQEVYINLWQGINKFRGESKLSTWIYKVAINSVLMAIRSTNSRIETTSIDINRIDISSIFDDEQKERLEHMYGIINQLDKMEKAIILLWLDETPYEEIAEIVDLNRNTVATKIRRIKEKLSKSI